MSVTRKLSGGPNEFSLSLIDNRRIRGGERRRRLRPGDWIHIRARVRHWSRLSKRYEHPNVPLLIGRILSVGKSEKATKSGGIIHTVEISGDDFGCVFRQAEIFFNPWLSEVFSNSGGYAVDPYLFANEDFVESWSQTINATPQQFIKVLISTFMGLGISCNQRMDVPEDFMNFLNRRGQWNDHVSGRNIFARMLAFREGLTAPNNVSAGLKGSVFDMNIGNLGAGGSGGSAWDALQRYANLAVNELFFELHNVTGSGQPTLVMREKPWPSWVKDDPDGRLDTEAWDDLLVTRIRSDEISTTQVSRNDELRFNYFLALPNMMGHLTQDTAAISGVFKGLLPIIDLQSINRHGLRRIEPRMMYTGFEAPTGGGKQYNYLDLMAAWSCQLASWFYLSHEYLNGIIQVPFLNAGEVGQKLVVQKPYNRQDLSQNTLWDEYYINGIKWSWSIGPRGEPTANTSYIVSRGLEDLRGRISSSGLLFRRHGAYPLPIPDQVKNCLAAIQSRP